MWKLKFSESKESSEELVISVNKHLGRQFWEFDPYLGTEHERAQVEQACKQFNHNRFMNKNSSDLLMRFQFEREKGYKKKEKVRKELVEDVISEKTVRKTLKRALKCYSNLQAEDGFWQDSL